MKTKAFMPAALVVLSTMATLAFAQEFKISDVGVDAVGRPVIRHGSDPAFYYILYRGTEVSQIVSAVDMALGVPVANSLTDPAAPPTTVFYRVRQVRVTQPLDTDGDGLDDIWELRFRKPGSALNPGDANEDHNGSGTPDIRDYQLPVASFVSDSSTVIAANNAEVRVDLTFSRSFAGNASVLLGGTAVPGTDYSIPEGYDELNQTAEIPVNGTKASFLIRLLDSPQIDLDRYLLLSLLEPATNAPARYEASPTAPVNHTLRITEGDLGIYAGTIEFTNQLASGSHPVRLALRSIPSGGVQAYVDATQSTFFRGTYLMPVTLSAEGGPGSFPQPILQQISSASLDRSLAWSLQFQPTIRPQPNVVESQATLRLQGLSASGKAVESQGQLRLVPVTLPQ